MRTCPTKERCVKVVSLTVIMKGVNKILTLLLQFFPKQTNSLQKTIRIIFFFLILRFAKIVAVKA
jgi:hypothetical protein